MNKYCSSSTQERLQKYFRDAYLKIEEEHQVNQASKRSLNTQNLSETEEDLEVSKTIQRFIVNDAIERYHKSTSSVG